MDEKTVIRYDAQLTSAAKNIFGDIVERAYVTTYDYSSDKDEIALRLNRAVFVKSEDGEINYSAETIWIRFTNDKLVEFSNSEWAYITLVSMDNAYEA